MNYNKFIYKINKYKQFIRDVNKNDISSLNKYQKKINLYYDELNNYIKNQNGGSNGDLDKYLKPTIDQIESKINENTNLKEFEEGKNIAKHNGDKIIEYLKDLLKNNKQNLDEIDKIRQEYDSYKNTIDTKHKREIEDLLNKIEEKVNQREMITIDSDEIPQSAIDLLKKIKK